MKSMTNLHHPEPAPSAEAAPAYPRRILYAEDMPELRDLMSAVLAHEGYEVETVDGGSEALERLKHADHGFDLLITDHHMPGLNGLELVRQTRALPYPGMIVVFSSEISEEVHDQYRRFAVDAILPKPIFPVTFRRVLETLFATNHPESGPGHVGAPHSAAHA
jgi:two-component system, chemotaxis family, chemotaxis protein CheY